MGANRVQSSFVMKRIAIFPLALALLGSVSLADDQTRNVQTELKNLGFYYGEVNGQQNSETTAALRRYQIRNGLEVTGTLNQDTLAALGMGAPKSKAPAPIIKPQPAPAPPAPPVVERKSPPVNLRKGETTDESDRDFLRREEARGGAPDAVAPIAPPNYEPPGERSVIDPPAPLDAPSPDFPVLFAGTPYSEAPLSVQQKTLRRAQASLAERGFYRDVIDGLPGPATEEALLAYQHTHRMTLTGRLDMDTLAQLRLLPATDRYSGPRASYREPHRTFRGIWINKGPIQFGLEFD